MSRHWAIFTPAGQEVLDLLALLAHRGGDLERLLLADAKHRGS
jgi:hypothetical protein